MDAVPSPPEGVTAHLYPRRRPGYGYLVLALAVACIDGVGIVTSVQSGRWIIAGIALIGGVVIVPFLTLLALAILVPSLRLNEARVTGQLSLSRRVDLDWHDVVVDVDEDAPKGRFRLDLGEESMAVDIRSWEGFRDFALLLASATRPAHRLTPAARTELARLLQLDQPAAGDAAPGL